MPEKYFTEVRSRKNLESAWRAVRRNGIASKSDATRREIALYESVADQEIRKIQYQIRDGSFVFAPARGVAIKREGKKDRPLVVADVRNRIVQRAILNVLVQVPSLKRQIRSPYSFGGISRTEGDELSGVPAAISSVLDAIREGGSFIVKSDISDFFTRIPKARVQSIIDDAVRNESFSKLFHGAITIELSNMADFRGRTDLFPLYEIGVAQGCSLSPLLGNLLLAPFDGAINSISGVRCVRYIDDFMIVAKDQATARHAFNTAKKLLSELGMSLSATKTTRANIKESFDFLGIEFSNGLLRPSRASQKKFLNSVESIFLEGRHALRGDLNKVDESTSLLGILSRVQRSMQGWGKHYYFTNDGKCFDQIDKQIEKMLGAYLGVYRDARSRAEQKHHLPILGLHPISLFERRSFEWPKRKVRSICST